MTLILVIIITLLVSINLNFGLLSESPGKYWRGWRYRLIFYGTLVGLTFYLGLPALTGPLWGLMPIITGFCVMNAFVTGGVNSFNASYHNEVSPVRPIIFGFIPILICIVIGFFSAEWNSNEKFRDAIGPVITEKSLEEVLPSLNFERHLEVSKAQAIYRSDEALSSTDIDGLETRFQISPASMTKQLVQGKMWWVAPLEFKTFGIWKRKRVSPGFLMVSAEDRRADYKIVTTLKQKYMISSFFGADLHRYVYNQGYSNDRLRDFSYEINDDFEARWVLTLLKPTVGTNLEKVQGIIEVNPETGEITEHDLDSVPAWVDRVYPVETIQQYLAWNGKYANGWGNVFPMFGPKNGNLYEPTQGMIKIPGANEELFSFTDLTSFSTLDETLTGYALVSSRTGQYYRIKASGKNSEAARKTLSDSFNDKGFYAVDPILYSAYGANVWGAPIIFNGRFKFYGVTSEDTTVTAYGGSVKEAFANFRRELAKSNSSIVSVDAEMIESTITILQVFSETVEGNQIRFLQTQEYPSFYLTGSSSMSPEILAIQPGNTARVKFLDTGDARVPLHEFDLHGINLRKPDY
mgnify:CR=1 FL=1